MLNLDISCVLQVNAVGVGAVLRRRNGDIVNFDGAGIVKFQMALWTVYYGDVTNCHIITGIKSQSLSFISKVLKKIPIELKKENCNHKQMREGVRKVYSRLHI